MKHIKGITHPTNSYHIGDKNRLEINPEQAEGKNDYVANLNHKEEENRIRQMQKLREEFVRNLISPKLENVLPHNLENLINLVDRKLDHLISKSIMSYEFPKRFEALRRSNIKVSFGTKVAALVAQSPTLSRQISSLQKAGWSIVAGECGKGSYCDRARRTITIDAMEMSNIDLFVDSLAHEIGHAEYGEQADYSSKTGYLNSRKEDEGAAALNQMIVQSEIGMKANSPPGTSFYSQLKNIYDQYLEDKDAKKARQMMGEILVEQGTSLVPDPDGSLPTPAEYYGRWYDEVYPDANRPPMMISSDVIPEEKDGIEEEKISSLARSFNNLSKRKA